MKYLILINIAFILFSCGSGKKESIVHENKSAVLFMELWEFFDKNYAFFELRAVDWEKERIDGLQNVAAFKNDSLLFEAFCNILKKFNDSHVNLESDRLNLYCNSGKLPDFFKEYPSNESFTAFINARDKSLQRLGIDKVIESESKLFQYGANADQKWGYLRIKRFYGKQLDKIQAELKYIFNQFESIENLIIDIRTNPGGNDETAILCASPFFKQKEIAFIKKTRNGIGHEDFSQPDTTYIYPNTEFLVDYKHIYLLTNSASGSSADVYALIMAYLPNLTIVGTNTEGIFSNMLRDTLSNGWRITLSNEKYYSKDMHCYEKIGIPVDIKVENKKEDTDRGIDSVIYTIINKHFKSRLPESLNVKHVRKRH